MAYETRTFTSSCNWHYTGSAIGDRASVECWGAGGHGGINGVGGSGGAYAVRTIILKSGTTYTITVGQPTKGDGGPSIFADENGPMVVAAGGRSDGTVEGQREASVGKLIHIGGLGGKKDAGYSNDSGAGGGGCAGADGDGFAGGSSRSATETTPALGGKYNNAGIDRRGGNGGYYRAGAGGNQVFGATAGQPPGCGGGGCYGYPTTSDTSAPGGQGFVSIWIDSSFN